MGADSGIPQRETTTGDPSGRPQGETQREQLTAFEAELTTLRTQLMERERVLGGAAPPLSVKDFLISEKCTK